MNINSNSSQLEALLKGDNHITQSLYTVLFPKVMSFILKNKGTKKDAEEIFQNALFQLITRAKVRPLVIEISLEAYIFVICKNLWRKELNSRKKGVRNDKPIEHVTDEEYHIRAIIEQERKELFEEKFQQLSEKCMQLLRDYFNKVPYNEIVAKFNFASENAAFQRVFKCKKKLADLIKSDPRYKNLT